MLAAVFVLITLWLGIRFHVIRTIQILTGHAPMKEIRAMEKTGASGKTGKRKFSFLSSSSKSEETVLLQQSGTVATAELPAAGREAAMIDNEAFAILRDITYIHTDEKI